MATFIAACQGFLTPVFIAWTVLLTQNNLHIINEEYNFVTQIMTCQNA